MAKGKNISEFKNNEEYTLKKRSIAKKRTTTKKFSSGQNKKKIIKKLNFENTFKFEKDEDYNLKMNNLINEMVQQLNIIDKKNNYDANVRNVLLLGIKNAVNINIEANNNIHLNNDNDKKIVYNCNNCGEMTFSILGNANVMFHDDNDDKNSKETTKIKKFKPEQPKILFSKFLNQFNFTSDISRIYNKTSNQEILKKLLDKHGFNSVTQLIRSFIFDRKSATTQIKILRYLEKITLNWDNRLDYLMSIASDPVFNESVGALKTFYKSNNIKISENEEKVFKIKNLNTIKKNDYDYFKISAEVNAIVFFVTNNYLNVPVLFRKHAILISLLFETGFRVSDLACLKYSDFTKNKIIITQKKTNVSARGLVSSETL